MTTGVGDERARLLAAVEALAPAVAEAAEAIERDRRLPDPLVDAMRAAGFFRMPMPQSWGGPELDPIVQFEVIEALSRLDASVGWVAMIGSDGGYYSANLPDDAARQLWKDLDAVTAGWLFPGGMATPDAEGFRVTGRWQFGSASLHADVIVGGVIVLDGQGGFRPGAVEGFPEMRIVCVPAEHAASIDTWHTTGLAGSGSNDYSLDDVLVPEDHTWVFDTPPVRPGPLYAFPYMFFSNIAAVPLGAARRALDELAHLARTKITLPAGTPWSSEARVQTAVARGEVLVSTARAWALSVLDELWDGLCRGEAPSPELRARFRLSSMQAFRASQEAIALAYETAGTTAIYRPNVLDRLLRDVTTMGQHILGSTKTLEPAGRVLLGLPADAPVF